MNTHFYHANPLTFLAAALSLAVFTTPPTLADTPYPITWKTQIGTSDVDAAYAMCLTGSSLYVLGSTDGSLVTNTNGSRDVVLLKYSTAGTPIWSQQFGTTSIDEGCGGVGVDSAGNVYASGSTWGSLGGTSSGGPDAWLMKFNSGGAVQWKTQLGIYGAQTNAFGMVIDPTGNSYLVGSTNGSLAGTNTGGFDIYIAKYNDAGVQQWKKQFGTAQNEETYHACVDNSGNVIVTGYTLGSLGGTTAGSTDAFIAKYNSSGTRVWAKQLGTSGDDYGLNVATDSAGNIYLAGAAAGALSGNTYAGSTDGFLAKYNSSGILQWVKEIGTATFDRCDNVTVDVNGNIIVSGPTTAALAGPYAGKWDAFVTAFDTTGNQLWATQFGTSANDITSALVTDASGNIFTSGSTGGPLGGAYQGGINDIFIAKLTNPVPEPSSLALLAIGTAALLLRRRDH